MGDQRQSRSMFYVLATCIAWLAAVSCWLGSLA